MALGPVFSFDDSAQLPPGLADKELLPDQHLVGAGYVDAANLLESHHHYGVDLLGPVRHNYWWQADTDFDLTHFSIDWQAQTVTCPHGRISSSWTPAQDGKGHPVIKIKFSASAIVRPAPIEYPVPG